MLFSNSATVEGRKLAEFLLWARMSFEWEDGTPPDQCVLALPPIQRNSAWNPRQVVDVWDSIFRGLPLGAFMLQKRVADKLGRAPNSGNKKLPEGWDLLDGQQRVRSLLLGLYGPTPQDKRCLWINLDLKSDRYLFDLRLTSASQPFGYDPSGYKPAPGVREAARNRFEPTAGEIRTGDRRAYNHELFGGFIDGKPSLELAVEGRKWPMPPKAYTQGWPPPPAGVKLTDGPPEANGVIPEGSLIKPLHDILLVWIKATGSKEEALAGVVGRNHPRFPDLLGALQRFDKAEIALVNATSVGGENLPLLYDRIGAGGTPLSNEERLFSFYKYHRSDFHDLVRDIHRESGRVMAPSKIAASAIRIANALAHQKVALRDQVAGNALRVYEGNGLPEIATFVRALDPAYVANNGVNLRDELNGLLNSPVGDAATKGRFATGFIDLIKALKYNGESNQLGLPTVLLWRLPSNLIQVLLFWLIHQKNEEFTNGDDLIRFAIFWLFCSRSDDKASNRGFQLIRENQGISLQSLCRGLRQDSSLARTPITPEDMKPILMHDPQPIWRQLHVRIGKQDPILIEQVVRWWWDDASFLPWLQRAYLDEAFRDFDPTADREDDTPYDVDHMVPQNDWGFDWRDREKRLDPVRRFTGDQLNELRWGRGDIGHSIGNKWLVDGSFNKSWGDKGFAAKLNDIDGGGDELRRLLDVFPDEDRALWIKASPDERTQVHWDDKRMGAFQIAIEKRAAWLYGRFYEELGFADWMKDVISS